MAAGLPRLGRGDAVSVLTAHGRPLTTPSPLSIWLVAVPPYIACVCVRFYPFMYMCVYVCVCPYPVPPFNHEGMANSLAQN